MSQEAKLFWEPDLAEMALERPFVAMAAAVQHECGIFGEGDVAGAADVELALRGQQVEDGAGVHAEVSEDLEQLVAQR